MAVTDSPIDPNFDFASPDALADGLPLQKFAQLRRTAPVWWNAQAPGTGGFDDGGLWVISKHADIKAISRDPDTWSTHDNGVIICLPDLGGPDSVEATKVLLINQDPPDHTRLRKVVSRMFVPRAVAELETKLKAAATRIVTEAAEEGSGDFVQDVAMKLPVLAISDLIGVPEADHPRIASWADSLMAFDDDAAGDDDPVTANAELLAYAYAMAEERRKCPTDDLVSKLVHADIDGHSLSELEFGFFVILLVIAGNETTRNAITHGINAFLDYPDQWELYKRERPVTTADEIVRWASPVYAFQRTARRDVEIGGVTITKGQRAGLFYGSANYDEEVFINPHIFDITRSPNPHLGFGGQGTHFCIGANLARMEIDLIFNAIADVIPDIKKVAEPQRLRSGIVNGLTHLPVIYR